MFASFCLRLAAGLVLSLLILPFRSISPRFYRIHLLISLGVTAAGGVFAWQTASDWFWLGFGLGTGACLVGPWCWPDAVADPKSGVGAGVGYACLVVATMGLISTASLLAMADCTSAIAILNVAGSSALLGLATTAMLIGHWYLISPTMSLAPLRRLLVGLFAAVGIQAALASVNLAHAATDRESWSNADLLWLFLRWGVGLVSVLALTIMAWQTAKIRSTQSATGILYVVVIFTYMGELAAMVLAGGSITPA